MVFNPKETVEETKAQIQESISQSEKERPAFSDFALLAGDEFIGDLALYFFENDPAAAEFSWVISPKHSKKGYGFEAAKEIMEYYRENKGITRFIAQCDSENIPSIRLIEKLGLKLSDVNGTRFNRSAPGVPPADPAAAGSPQTPHGLRKLPYNGSLLVPGPVVRRRSADKESAKMGECDGAWFHLPVIKMVTIAISLQQPWRSEPGSRRWRW